jgi:hydrogenase small subunit
MPSNDTFYHQLRRRGLSRRAFLKFCTVTASALALPPEAARVMAQTLASTRPTVIWLSFQECTGCTESVTRSYTPTLESLILSQISLDYHHTLQWAAGTAAEAVRESITDPASPVYGKYVLVVDGSIPSGDKAYWSAIAGVSNREMFLDAARGAALIVAVGTCAAFGGLPAASPNPSGAASSSASCRPRATPSQHPWSTCPAARRCPR